MAKERNPKERRSSPIISGTARFLMLFGFWMALSGQLSPLLLGLGVISAVLVTVLSHSLGRKYSAAHGEFLVARGKEFFHLARFALYTPWILWQIMLANLQVAYLVLHPRQPIDPVLLRFKTPLRGEGSQVLLAHSITLTPGTITVDAHEGVFLVHAITPGSANLLLEGEMQRRVEHVFAVSHEPPADTLITRTVQDLDLWPV